MLSRVADSLYWMARYLERAEHTARLVDVHLNLMLDQSPSSSLRCWRRVLRSLDFPQPEGELDPYSVAQNIAFDMGSQASIVTCITSARENARQVREQISSEMWEQLNRMFHEVRRAGMDEVWDAQPQEFLQAIKQGAHLFQGITNSTMAHGEGWQFIRIGRYMERARSSAILLDQHFRDLPQSSGGDDEHIEWIGLLRSCTAFESYCKVYTAELRPDRVAEFLLLNPSFPHSICFAVESFHGALDRISVLTSTNRAARLTRLAGRLRATLEYSHIDEIMANGLHQYLAELIKQCQAIHTAIYQTYVSYPIEAALEA